MTGKSFYLCLLLLCALTLQAGRINLKDLGAKGDGVTDDTAAFWTAMQLVDQQGERIASGHFPIGIHDRSAIIGVGERDSVPEIFIPAGTYKVSKTIVLPATGIIRGEEGTVIEMTDPEQDVFYVHWAFRLRVSDITIRGGNRQLLICTCNNESARMIIDGCRFENSNGTALDCRSYANPDGTDYMTIPRPAYNLEFDGIEPKLTPNSWEGYNAFNNSTLFVCRNSEFINCKMAVDVGADGASFNDCTFVSETFPALRIGFPYGGHSYINRCRAIAETTGSEAWIRSYTINLAVRDCSFEGAPRAVIEHNHDGQIKVPTSILITNTAVSCAGTEDDAVIRIPDGFVLPSCTELFRVTETSGNVARAIVWETDPTWESLMASRFINQIELDVYRATQVEWPFAVSMGENINIDESLPDALQESFSVSVIPDAAYVPALEFSFPEPALRLKAADFGVDADPATDDTAAMQKALAAAAEAEGMVELEMPDSLPQKRKAWWNWRCPTVL